MQPIHTGRFKAGQVFRLHGKPGQIMSILEDGTANVAFEGEIPQAFAIETLFELYAEDKLRLGGQAPNDNGEEAVSALTDAQRRQIEERTPYVMPLFCARAPTKRSVRKAVADQAQLDHPGFARLSNNAQYYFYKRVKDLNGSRLGLIDPIKKAKHRVIADPELRTIVEHVFENKYMKGKHYSQKTWIVDVNALVDDRNIGREAQMRIPQLSQSSASRYVKSRRAIDPLQHDRKRLGEAHYRSVLRSTGQPQRATRILESAQIDFTQLDLILVDPDAGIVLGKPTIGTMICEASKGFLGFAIGFEGETSRLAAQVLRNSILPKDKLIEQFGSVMRRWQCYGIPFQVKTDLGSSFISDAFNDVCDLLNIDRLNNPAASPWLKPQVEQLFSTIGHQVLSHFPAHTKREGDTAKLVEQGKCPALTVDMFYEVLIAWIVNVYMQEPHGEVGLIPNTVWAEQEKKYMPRMPASVKVLDLAIGHRKTRTMSEAGIKIHNLRYASADLVALRSRFKHSPKKVDVKFMHEDLGHIYVYNPLDAKWFSVPCSFGKYARGLSLREHKMIRRLAKEKKIQNETQNNLVEVRRDHRELCKDLSKTLKSSKKTPNSRKIRSTLRQYIVASGDFGHRQQEVAAMKGAIMGDHGLEGAGSLDTLEKRQYDHDGAFDLSAFDEAEGEDLLVIENGGASNEH